MGRIADLWSQLKSEAVQGAGSLASSAGNAVERGVRQAPASASNYFAGHVAQPVMQGARNFFLGDSAFGRGIDRADSVLSDGRQTSFVPSPTASFRAAHPAVGFIGNVGAGIVNGAISAPFDTAADYTRMAEAASQGGTVPYGQLKSGLARLSYQVNSASPGFRRETGTDTSPQNVLGDAGRYASQGLALAGAENAGKAVGDAAGGAVASALRHGFSGALMGAASAFGGGLDEGRGGSLPQQAGTALEAVPVGAALGFGLGAGGSALGGAGRFAAEAERNRADLPALAKGAQAFRAEVPLSVDTEVNGVPVSLPAQPVTREIPVSQMEEILRKGGDLNGQVLDYSKAGDGPTAKVTFDDNTKRLLSWDTAHKPFIKRIDGALSQGQALQRAPGAVGNVEDGRIRDANAPLSRPEPAGSQGMPLQEPLRDNNPKFNVNRLNVTPEAKQVVSENVDSLIPKIKEQMGAKMSLGEIASKANESGTGTAKAVTREQTLKRAAETAQLRQQVAADAQSGATDPEAIRRLMTAKSVGTDLARQLNALKIDADPAGKTALDEMIGEINRRGHSIDDVVEASKKYDLSDPKQQAIFYREFVKPKAKDWIDLLRYNSMLSSPNTHINNAAGNLGNSALIRPVEKTVAGAIDFLAHPSGGQTRFAGEGAAYAKGYWSKLGDAAHAFADSMAGKSAETNLDTRQIPLAPGGGVAGAAEKALSYPMKLLEASDQFFTALAQGGETSSLEYRQAKSGKLIPNLAGQAKAAADYQLYRSDLHPEGQGHMLDSIDDLTQKLQELRSSPNPVTSTIAKFTVPFVKTPMNIFKQGVEYSPLGFATVPGSADATGQIAKAAIGTAVFGGAATLLGSGRIMWAAPTGANERQAWDAAHMQPYSVKVGNTWVAYNKLPPGIAFPMALVASIDDMERNGQLDATTTDKVLTAVASYGGFLSDQSYAQGVGNILQAAKNGKDGIAKVIAGDAQQLVPYRALSGWLARLTDPLQRDTAQGAGTIGKQVQLLMQQFPGLSERTPAKADQYGQPIDNRDRVANAFSPARISTEDPQGARDYGAFEAAKAADRQAQGQVRQFQSGGQAAAAPSGALPDGVRALANGKYAYKNADGTVGTAATAKAAAIAQAKDQVSSGLRDSVTVEGKLVTADGDGNVVTKDIAQMQRDADTQRISLALDAAKRTGDYAAWEALQKQQYSLLGTQAAGLNPATDQAKVYQLRNQQADIANQVSTYRSYGGAFSKPKKGRGASVPTGSAHVRLASVKAPKVRAVRAGSSKVKALKNPRKPKVKLL